jgi:hypothetical protein
MRRLSIRLPAGALGGVALVAGLLALAPAAGAQTALEEYQRTGQINPCTATAPGGIPNDVEQYAPDFLEALRDAQRRGCNRGVSETRPTRRDDTGAPVASDGSALPPGSTYVPKPPAPPRPFRDDREVRHLPLAAAGDGVATPAPVIALAVMLLLAVAGGALAATWRYLGWGLERLDPLRHGFAEAAHRVGGGLAALSERLRRLGRRGA